MDKNNGCSQAVRNLAFNPARCPKWNLCNSPACPLDPDWQKRVVLNYDPVCFYMTEAVKANAEAVFQGAGKADLFSLISVQVEPFSARWGRVKRKLAIARTSGSRMDRLPPSLRGANK